jgi:hypothetical protein
MHEVCTARDAAHNAQGLSECYGLSLRAPLPRRGFRFAALCASTPLARALWSAGNAAESGVTAPE